jgi:NodT family efflux transporter outer membrane factor (OMF) lipoprotein
MKRWRVSISVLIAAACLGAGGCEVGPNFRAPPPPSESSYIAPAAPGPATTGPPLQSFALGQQMTAEWWTLFHSAALDTLVKQAVAGSWSLQAARARLGQAQEAVAAAASALWPQLSLSASVAHEKLTAASFGLPASALALPANFTLLQVGPVASYSLDLFGGTRRRIEQAQALAQSQTDELRAVYLTLTGNTVLQAIELAALGAQRQALGDIIDLDRRTLDLVQIANRVGSIPDNDVVSAQTQLAQDQALLPPLDQSQISTAHALAVLLGRAPGEWLPPVMELDALTLPEQVPVSLPSQLVHQRPDILAAEAQLHAASAQVGVATAALYPDISLSAFVTGTSLNGSNLFNPANLAWSVAAGLTQPLFDGHLRRSERREALAAYRASAADYQQTVLEAFQQVADLLQALDHDAKLLVAEKAALDFAAHSVDLQRAAYVGGGSGILGLLDAQRQYHQASLQYVRAQGQRYQDTAQLFVAMGGGWWRGDLR